MLTFAHHPILLRQPSHDRVSGFELKWAATDTQKLWGATLTSMPAEGALEALMSPARIYCMASGDLGDVRKYYFYSRNASGPPWYMVEVTAAASSKRLSAVFKAEGNEAWRTDAYVALFKGCLGDTIAASPRASSSKAVAMT